MSTCNKLYTIFEYGGEKTFDALEAFILANNTRTKTDAVELLSLSARRTGYGTVKIITARNYVGLITMNNGTVIEILPKIAGENFSESETKKIFLEMLKTLKDVTFKSFNFSSLYSDRLNLLEIFIKMFLDEVTILTKQGIKAAYTPIEVNERFFKGKLLTYQNIKNNLLHKERFFVRYEDFNVNRPENRLIKSTLRFLRNVTNDECNRRNATRLLTFFDGVKYSTNYDYDFSKCYIDRSMNHYNQTLAWCRVFLKGNSFTAFPGSEVALALLFPMEKVFESFIAAKFRKFAPKFHIRNNDILIQDSRYSLFDSPVRAFSLRPDIVLILNGRTVVLDTKWKLLSDNARNNGISQADMYQMYVYSKKYDAERVILIYPDSDAVSKTNIKYSSNDKVNVNIAFIDLKNANGSIQNILAEICQFLSS